MGGCAVNRRRLAASTTKKHALTLLAVVVLLLVTAVILCTITIKGVKFSEMGPPRPAAAFATHQHEEEPAARDRHADSSTDGMWYSWYFPCRVLSGSMSLFFFLMLYLLTQLFLEN